MAITYLSGKRIQGSSAPLGNISKSNLKAYFTLDETGGSDDMVNTASAIGSTHAISNFNLSVTGATRNQTGKVNKALSFTGDNKAQADDSNLADTDFISQTGAIWTICLWVKLDSRVGDQMFVSTFDANANQGGIMFRLINTSGGINIICGGIAANDKIVGSSTSAVIPDTDWNFVMCQYSDTTGDCKMSVNNGTVETIASSQNLTNTVTPTNRLIVGNSPQLDNDLNGDLDEISIWNRILTAAEITAIYDANNSGDNLSTVQTAGADEKTLVTDVPLGSEFEQTNNYKTYQYGQTLVSGTGLKAYYRFIEIESPFYNLASNVAGDDAISSSNLVVTDDSDDGITYQDSTVAGNIPSVARWTSSSASDGAYAEAGVASDWNFLHYNSSNTDNQPKCTVCWWYNTGAVLSNSMFFTTTQGDATSGFRGLNIYQSNWEGGGATWRIFVTRSGGKLYQIEAPDDYIEVDNAWHFYSLTYDGTTMSLKKDLGDEEVASVSGSPAAGDAYSVLCFQHINAGAETYIPPPNNTAELSIWDRVLTSAELTTIYGGGDGFNLIDGTKVWVERGTAI